MKDRTRSLLFLLGILLALLIVKSISGIMPRYLELRSQLEAESQKLSQLNQQIENLPGIEKKKEEALREFYDLLEDLHISFDDETSFLLAVKPPQANLRITGFRPLEEEKQEALSFRPYEIGVSGEYGALVNYLAYLENLNALTEVKEIKINSDEKDEGTVKASLVVRLYKLGLEERG